MGKELLWSEQKEKNNILQRLNTLDIIKEQRELLPYEVEEWNTLKNTLESIYLAEEMYWKHKSKQTWLEEGDQNTKYFYVIASHRKKQNRINTLNINNNPTQSLLEIRNHVTQYYKEVLGSEGIKYAGLDENFWTSTDKVTQEENFTLEAPFTLEEIKLALFECEPNGASGPDGFSFKFYQHFWDVVKDDLYQMCIQFHQGTLHLDKLNKSVICLIPKEHNALTINKYRPISLVNCSFKLLSKILTLRLGQIMNRLIDESQAAFWPNRYILDNVVLSQELIHYSKIHEQKGIILKIDFEKTYDKIHWKYLLEVLTSRGFGPLWISWIQKWLTSSQSCINVNGELTPYFYCKKESTTRGPSVPFFIYFSC